MQALLLSNTERHGNFANPYPRIIKRKMLKLQLLVRAFNKPGLVAYQTKKEKIMQPTQLFEKYQTRQKY